MIDYTGMYLGAVLLALASPGQWVEVPRLFVTRKNAAVTGYCLAHGYLRVKPRDDASIVVNGRRRLRTAAPVAVKVDGAGDEWRLYLRTEAAQ